MNRDTQQYLRVSQQNLNKSLTAQLHLLNTVKPDDWDVLMIQEPWMAFNGTRATPHWRVLYPKIYFEDKSKPLRSIILVNARIPTNNYEQLQFNMADVTGLNIKTENGKVDLINVYNDCNNDDAIHAVSEFLADRYPDDHMPNDTHIIIGGDFNRHHPWWESEDNVHLTSAEQMIRPLLDLTARFDLRMALPPNLPTLQAFSTGNWTRPDNVWCSNHTVEHFVRCETDPGMRGPNTDHLPIQSVLDMRLPRNAPRSTRNFRVTEWDKFRGHLVTMLANAPAPERIRTPEELRETLDTINLALKATIETQVPLRNPIPYTKRWWNHDLSAARRKK